MEDKNQKERLEQELRFLKESYEAEVISKEEYEKGKDRTEKKLKEIENPSLVMPLDETKENETSEPAKNPVPQENPKEEYRKEPLVRQEQEKEIQEQETDSKFFKYAAIFVVLIVIIFISYSILKDKKPSQEKPSPLKFADGCSSLDCKQEENNLILKTKVIILNGRKDCFNCDTQRVLSILESWLGDISAKEVDYNTKEGKNLSEKLQARLLPMYILDESTTKNQIPEQFKKAFIKQNDNYILSENAAGSSFYFKRENMPGKLDLFIIPNDNASLRSEKNLREFLETFKEVKFHKHVPLDNFTEELGIKTFPTFLVNNRVRFSGVHTAQSIKDNFCMLNQLEACKKNLSKNLV